MTVTTMLWPTNGTGDGTGSGYTDAQTQRLFRLVGGLAGREDVAGVFYGEGGSLEVTYDSASTLEVAAGAALVYGIPLFSSAVEVLVLPSVAATTGGVVYARVNWATQLGTIAVRQNTSGNTAIPALVQTAGTTWEIALATYQVTSGGVATVTDARTFCNVSLRERTLPLITSRTYTPYATPLEADAFGLYLDTGVSQVVVFFFSVGEKMLVDLPVRLIVVGVEDGLGTGNAVMRLRIAPGQFDVSVPTPTTLFDGSVAIADAFNYRELINEECGSYLEAGDNVLVHVYRDGDDGADTGAPIYLSGVRIQYYEAI